MLKKYEVVIPFTGFYRLVVGAEDEEHAIDVANEVAFDVDIADLVTNTKEAKVTSVEDEDFDDFDYDEHGNKIKLDYSFGNNAY